MQTVNRNGRFLKMRIQVHFQSKVALPVNRLQTSSSSNKHSEQLLIQMLAWMDGNHTNLNYYHCGRGPNDVFCYVHPDARINRLRHITRLHHQHYPKETNSSPQVMRNHILGTSLIFVYSVFLFHCIGLNLEQHTGNIKHGSSHGFTLPCTVVYQDGNAWTRHGTHKRMSKRRSSAGRISQ